MIFLSITTKVISDQKCSGYKNKTLPLENIFKIQETLKKKSTITNSHLLSGNFVSGVHKTKQSKTKDGFSFLLKIIENYCMYSYGFCISLQKKTKTNVLMMACLAPSHSHGPMGSAPFNACFSEGMSRIEPRPLLFHPCLKPSNVSHNFFLRKPEVLALQWRERDPMHGLER